MALIDHEKDMLRCARCSECKWVPLAKIQSWKYAQICPSISRYNFHSYSGGGKLILGLSMLKERITYTREYLNILYRCQLCGACDIACKCNKDIEPLDISRELRVKAVEDGQLIPAHMMIIDGLRKEDNMLLASKVERGNWAKGLDVKNIFEDKAEVYFHAGCRYSYDEELWPAARSAVNLLTRAGVDIGIAGKDENCCGCRANELGYLGEFRKYAENNIEMLKSAGIKTIVTACADCYYGFKFLYPNSGISRPDLEVLHITEYLDRLIKSGQLKPKKKLPLTVTYHDPCHLGRLGEPFIPWKGVEKKVFNHMNIYDPPKPLRKGTLGVYEPPRDIIQSIPGLNLKEMERIKEYAWCCGAGGGVIDAFPDFANWAALQRLEEAKSTGAEAIVTACPWCKRNFTDALQESGDSLKVFDIIELLDQAI